MASRQDTGSRNRVANQTLCNTCLQLFVRPEEDWTAKSRAIYTRDGVEKAAGESCSICSLVNEAFLELGLDSRKTEHTSFEAVLSISKAEPRADEPSSELADEIGRGGIFFQLGKDDFNHHFSMSLDGYEDQERYAVLKAERFHPHGCYQVPINENILAGDSSDEQRMATLDNWIDTCRREHSGCNEPSKDTGAESTFLPSRLIHTLNPQHPHLVTRDELNTQTGTDYATVSHKWRRDTMPKLLRSNLHEMRQHIQIHLLPKVFQDSITLCQRLGIRYLWIDALCLIQDDPEDCQKEIAKMGEIYSMAVLNIGAQAAAMDSSLGLYAHAKDMGTLKPIRLRFERRNFNKNLIAYSFEAGSTIDASALMKRGWVLQERMLSIRSVYFGTKLTWECAEMLATEIFPGGVPFHGIEYWGITHPLRLRAMLSTGANTKRDVSKAELHERWLTVVSKFSSCRLTFEKDALPAISGLAKAFSTCLQERYVAGLWEGECLQGLLWYCDRSHYSYVRETRPAEYIGKLAHSTPREEQLTDSESTVMVLVGYSTKCHVSTV